MLDESEKIFVTKLLTSIKAKNLYCVEDCPNCLMPFGEYFLTTKNNHASMIFECPACHSFGESGGCILVDTEEARKELREELHFVLKGQLTKNFPFDSLVKEKLESKSKEVKEFILQMAN